MKGSDGRWGDIKINYANFVMKYNNHAEKCAYQNFTIQCIVTNWFKFRIL